MRALVGVVLLLCTAVGVAGAATRGPGTERVTAGLQGEPADGASSRPAVDPRGRIVAFDSEATNLTTDPNGAIRDVFAHDRDTGRTVLVSATPDGMAADGPSDSPVVAAGGQVVFTSRATNLVPGDTNGARDVFVRAGDAAPRRVSVATGGAEANGPSFQPDVTRDGRYIVFTSFANNLVPGDTNGVEDVFLHDLAAGTTRRVSERGGASFSGRSRAASISPDGGWVSFESTASDVVERDTNRVPDVFLKELSIDRIQRVSMSSRGRQQNRAVVPAFVTISDVSKGGRFVVWDSDATNLVRGDRNLDTDVFVRDVRRGRTRLVSRSSTGRQADNDSYLPSISESGRFVTFSSFAGNLWPQDRAGEDVFLLDRRLATTTPITVTDGGRRRGTEPRRQLLRRASLAGSASVVAFSSGARLVASDRGSVEDVFVRRTRAPSGRILAIRRGSRRPRYRLTADDRAAVFLCRVDNGRRFMCPRTGRLPRLRRGRHRLTVRAGGPGMLFDASADVRSFVVR